MSGRRSALLVAASALLAITSLAGTAPAATQPVPSLEGYFLLTGRITSAVNVRGVHRGQVFRRTWLFLPACRVGACANVVLVRGGRHAPVLLMRRTGRTAYAGSGSFTAPLRCGRRLVTRGESAPFTITVRITASRQLGASLVATSIRARYSNPRRVNHTRCVAIAAHESASYRLRGPTFR